MYHLIELALLIILIYYDYTLIREYVRGKALIDVQVSLG